jgi:hypothetical protein
VSVISRGLLLPLPVLRRTLRDPGEGDRLAIAGRQLVTLGLGEEPVQHSPQRPLPESPVTGEGQVEDALKEPVGEGGTAFILGRC